MVVNTSARHVALTTKTSIAITKAVSEAFATFAAPVAAASCEADGILDELLESPLVVSAIADVVLIAESLSEVELDPSLAEPGRKGSILVDFGEDDDVCEPGSLDVEVPEGLVAPLLDGPVLLEDGDAELDAAEELELLGSKVLSFAPMPMIC